MLEKQVQVRNGGHGMTWVGPVAMASAEGRTGVVLESVDARAGNVATRRVFRGWLRNHGATTMAVTLEVSLPAPFLPSAPVLGQRLFVIAPGERLRVELGSTVGAAPSTDEVRQAALLRVG